jgi:hypothetical protein
LDDVSLGHQVNLSGVGNGHNRGNHLS